MAGGCRLANLAPRKSRVLRGCFILVTKIGVRANGSPRSRVFIKGYSLEGGGRGAAAGEVNAWFRSPRVFPIRAFLVLMSTGSRLRVHGPRQSTPAWRAEFRLSRWPLNMWDIVTASIS